MSNPLRKGCFRGTAGDSLCCLLWNIDIRKGIEGNEKTILIYLVQKTAESFA